MQGSYKARGILPRFRWSQELLNRFRDSSMTAKCSCQSGSRSGPSNASQARKNSSRSAGDSKGWDRLLVFEPLVGGDPEPLAQGHAFALRLTDEAVTVLVGDH